MGSGAKSFMRKECLLYEECANISPYMRRLLVTYDFAPDPSEFPYIGGKFYFIFYQCLGCIFSVFQTKYIFSLFAKSLIASETVQGIFIHIFPEKKFTNMKIFLSCVI